MEFLGFVLILVLALVALARGRRHDGEIRKLHEGLERLGREIDRLKRAVQAGTAPAAGISMAAGTMPAAVTSGQPAISPLPSATASPPAAPARPLPAPPPLVVSARAQSSPETPRVPAVPSRAPAETAGAAPWTGFSAAPASKSATVAAPRPTRSGEIDAWETRIGGSWLNRIGVALVVIGIAFALGYSFTQLGPAGRAALATASSLVMIGGGVLLERREGYEFYGRGLIGGGWAALYATAYAVHELPATRIVEDARAGFALLLLVGAGMIGHSLRYDNEGLTSLAYALAYAAIVLHSIEPYTLAAAALLGFGTVMHQLRRSWYLAALGGAVATYGCLFLWASKQTVLTTEVLQLGLLALVIDWAVFLVPDFAREPANDSERQYAWASSLFNAFAAGLVSYVFWTKAMPSGGWRPLFVFGSAYAVTSTALRLLGRRAIQPAHSLAAALLLAVGFHKGLDRTRATWAWLAEAQALVLLGVFLKDRFHRMLGCWLFLAPMIAIFYDQVQARLARPHGVFDPTRFLQTVVACGCFYLTYGRLRAFASSGEAGRAEDAVRRLFSYAAFLLVLLALWVQLPEVWVAPAAAVFFLLLFEISAVWSIEDLRVQGYLAALYAALTGIVLSIPSGELLAGRPARIPALLIVAGAFFVVFLRQSGGRAGLIEADEGLRPIFSWAGTLTVALLVWLEARPTLVGPAWVILALLLIETGVALKERHLRFPGYVLLVASHVSLVMSNLTAAGQAGGLSVRALTIAPAIAATYYLWWRLRSVPESKAASGFDERDEFFGRLVCYLGGALAGLFVRFEFGLQGAALRWSFAMVALFVAGHFLRDADLRFQGYILAAAVFVRAVGFDFRDANPILGLDGALLIAFAGVVCYIAAGFLIRARQSGAAERRADRRSLAIESTLELYGQDAMWLLAVGLAAVYLYRTQSGVFLIVAWSIEGLAAAAAGFVLKARSFRLSGLALLGLCVAMTLVRAFTTFDIQGKIVTFIVLGVVLLLISFAYTRYRQSLRKAS